MQNTFTFHPQQNCWRQDKASRVSFLIDGEAYFSTLADVLEKAERAIYIIGWDIDSRIRLRRDESDEQGEILRQTLNRLAERNRKLHIYLLNWDFAMLYALEREPLPLVKLGWQTHDRVHFHMDDRHPVGSSHHQKMVVVDDQIAFVGGLDLTRCRWDTPEHAPEEPRRCDNDVAYTPFHDVQMMVEGPVAGALGDLARRRWKVATDTRLRPPKRRGGDIWPPNVQAEFEQVDVAIMRTEPRYEENEPVQEIKEFYLEAIAAARQSIYIENQYLTAHAIGAALEERLKEKDGPDVVIVLPKSCAGWLEENTMGLLRTRLLDRLHRADSHKRLGVYCPTRIDLGEKKINVHSKILIVDDNLVRIGSSNLNNRSMGFDTECDLAIAAEHGDEKTRQSIASLRNRLLAEHLDCREEDVGKALREQGSLKKAIENLRGRERTLENLPDTEQNWMTDFLSETDIVDPEKPVSMDRLLNILDINANQESANTSYSKRRKIMTIAVGLLLALGLAAAWRWTPLADWVDRDTLISSAQALRRSIWAIPAVLAVFVVGSLLMFPITVLIFVTAVAFGPVTGFFLALGGSMLGAIASFGLGYQLGRQTIRKLVGEKVNTLSRRLSKRGWLAVALVRLVPIAPFTIVNMVAGASHISLRDFILGTLGGMGPGILAIVLVEGSLEHVLQGPSPANLLVAAALIVSAVLIFWGSRRWSRKHAKQDHG